jgi:hypothetical protein
VGRGQLLAAATAADAGGWRWRRYLLFGSDQAAMKSQFLGFFSEQDWRANEAMQVGQGQGGAAACSWQQRCATAQPAAAGAPLWTHLLCSARRLASGVSPHSASLRRGPDLAASAPPPPPPPNAGGDIGHT